MIDAIFYYLGRINPFWYVVILVTVIYTLKISHKKYICDEITKLSVWARTFFLPYFELILILTFLIRLPNNEIHYEIVPFWSYHEIFLNHDTDLLIQNFYNIAVFIPLGFLMPCCEFKIKGRNIGEKETLIFGICFSAFIEITQLVTRLGYFEFDDMIHNTLGVIIGILLMKAIKMIFVKIKGE